eukprot:gene11413-12442_t
MGCQFSYDLDLSRGGSTPPIAVEWGFLRMVSSVRSRDENKEKDKEKGIEQTFPLDKCYLARLPESLYIFLRPYLNSIDYLKLMGTSKTLFKVTRFTSAHFNLNSLVSYQYSLDCSIKVRNYLSTRLKSSSSQLGLSFHRLSEAEFTHSMQQRMNCLYQVKLMNCFSIRSAAYFDRVPDLHLGSCHNLSNISALGKHQKKVALIDCDLIQDISSLQSVPIVILRDCPSVKDVTCLTTAYHLEVSRCAHITSITQFPTNSSRSFLHFEPCLNHINDIDVKSLSVYALKATLINCRNLDVNSLHGLTNLTLFHCHLIDDITALGNIQRVTLSYCNNITSVIGLGSVRHLHICHCNNLISLEGLGPGNYSITLKDCSQITNLLPLQHMKQITLSNYFYDIDCSLFQESIECLVLIDCRRIRNIHTCKRLTSLRMKDCRGIKRIDEGFNHIQRIIVQRCTNLVDIRGCLGSEGNLMIEDCKGIYFPNNKSGCITFGQHSTSFSLVDSDGWMVQQTGWRRKVKMVL